MSFRALMARCSLRVLLALAATPVAVPPVVAQHHGHTHAPGGTSDGHLKARVRR